MQEYICHDHLSRHGFWPLLGHWFQPQVVASNFLSGVTSSNSWFPILCIDHQLELGYLPNIYWYHFETPCSCCFWGPCHESLVGEHRFQLVPSQHPWIRCSVSGSMLSPASRSRCCRPQSPDWESVDEDPPCYVGYFQCQRQYIAILQQHVTNNFLGLTTKCGIWSRVTTSCSFQLIFPGPRMDQVFVLKNHKKNPSKSSWTLQPVNCIPCNNRKRVEA